MDCKNPEVLAPVGNMDALYAAVRTGADAVYLGMKNLNARQGASNFSEEELASAVSYCHGSGVKVFLTLNTLVFDSELDEVFRQIKLAANLALDGIIVQDLAVASLCRHHCPELPLHGSTQLSVHTKGGAKTLKRLGFSRVVLARELKKEEIREISEAGLELEMFVHGALCMSLSGQCHLSGMLGGRSGNRGRCAGPCRLPFSALGRRRDVYDLSLKDLSLIQRLDEIKELGISSLKIEGRQKSPEYVAVSTAAVRAAVDGVAFDESLLSDVFSREGFSSGYFDSGQADFGTRQEGDKASSREAMPKARALFRAERKSVPISMNFRLTEEASLTVSDHEGNTISLFDRNSLLAEQKPLQEEEVLTRLSKTGGTPFFLEKYKIDCDGIHTMKASALNALRREALDKLFSKRGEKKSLSWNPAPLIIPERVEKKPFQWWGTYEKVTQVSSVDFEKLHMIGLPVYAFLEELPSFFDFKKMYALLPFTMFGEEERIALAMERCREKGVDRFLVNNIGQYELAKKSDSIFAGTGLNITNSLSIAENMNLGSKMFVSSLEWDFSLQKKAQNILPMGAMLYGRTRLMVMRSCPLKNAVSCETCEREGYLVDRLGIRFPVFCKGSYSELFNSRPLWLADKKKDFDHLSFGVLSFTTEKRREIRDIIDAYKEGDPSDEEFTRGLYYKRV